MTDQITAVPMRDPRILSRILWESPTGLDSICVELSHHNHQKSQMMGSKPEDQAISSYQFRVNIARPTALPLMTGLHPKKQTP